MSYISCYFVITSPCEYDPRVRCYVNSHVCRREIRRTQLQTDGGPEVVRECSVHRPSIHGFDISIVLTWWWWEGGGTHM